MKQIDKLIVVAVKFKDASLVAAEKRQSSNSALYAIKCQGVIEAIAAAHNLTFEQVRDMVQKASDRIRKNTGELKK